MSVSVDELIDASIAASNIADHIDDALRRFGTEVDSLLTTWRGLSASQFGVAWAEWREGADSVVSGLRTTGGLLDESAQGYAQRESITTDHINRSAL